MRRDKNYACFGEIIDLKSNKRLTVDQRTKFIHSLIKQERKDAEKVLCDISVYNSKIKRLSKCIRNSVILNVIDNCLMNYKLVELLNQISVVFSLFVHGI